MTDPFYEKTLATERKYTGNFDATYDDILEGCTAMLTVISALDDSYPADKGVEL